MDRLPAVLFGLALLLSPSLAAAQGRMPLMPAVDIVDYGVVDDTPVVGTEPSDTLVGHNQLIDPSVDVAIAETTADVKACIGTRFGIKYRLRAGAAVPVTVKVKHPEQVAPDGRRASESTWTTLAVSGTRYTGWQFEAPYELVEGTWTFEIVVRNRVAARQSFVVRHGTCAFTS